MARHVKDYAAALALLVALLDVPGSVSFVLGHAAVAAVEDVRAVAVLVLVVAVPSAVVAAGLAEVRVQESVTRLVQAHVKEAAEPVTGHVIRLVPELVAAVAVQPAVGVAEDAEDVLVAPATVLDARLAVVVQITVPGNAQEAVIQDVTQAVKILVCHLAAAPALILAADNQLHQLYYIRRDRKNENQIKGWNGIRGYQRK